MNKAASLAAAISVVLVGMYGCAPNPTPFDPARMQKNSREGAAQRPPAEQLQPLPTTMDTTYSARRGRPATNPALVPSTGPALNSRPIVRMTLQESLHRVVNNNLEIRVAGYDPGINSQRVTEAEAKFDPTFFFNPFSQWRNQQGDANNLVLASSSADIWGASSGIRQDLETGGTAELRYETAHGNGPTNNFPGANNLDMFSSNLVADLKQPLLKNFGVEVNRARITVSRNDQKISLLDFRKKLEENLFKAEENYWQLLESEREVDIAERLVSATIETANLLQKRAEQDVTRVEISQANSALQSRRAALITAKSRLNDLSDQLKRLMADPDYPVAGEILVMPATDPLKTPIKFDGQDQINQALEHRLELAQQLLRIDSASLVTRVAKNNLLPSLALDFTYTANGAATNWDVSASNMMDFAYNTYRVGFQFEVPIGNRQAEAIYQRTLLQRQQAIDQYRDVIEQVSLEVSQAVRAVRTAWEQTVASRQATFATADTLDAINLRIDRGEPLTPTFVQLKLDTQARLGEAQRAEAQALASYCIAVAQLERAKGTLLRYDNVTMVEDRLDVLARARFSESNIPAPVKMLPGQEQGVSPIDLPVLMPMENPNPSR